MALYIVSTPIGNLEDITLRALRILKEVDLIASEDTRVTLKLLNHYGIKNKLMSYHEHNKIERTKELIKLLKEGKNIALVSDSGTPGIQDPGFYLIREAVKNNIEVIPVPGPAAFVAALVKSGLPMERFIFAGFLPRRSGRRKKYLKEFKGLDLTVVFYEAPHRIVPFLKDLYEVFGDREIAVVRELTKKFESIQYGKISELIEFYEEKEPRGEFVIILPKSEE